MIFFGVVAALFFTLSFIGSIKLFLNENVDGGRHASLEAALWFIAMCICFK